MSNTPELLVVDDEEVICGACHRIFSAQGFHVESSSDAVDGLGLAIEKEYAAILLDIKMPVLDGIQFLQRLRKRKPDVPVILITGYPSVQSVAAAMRLGAVDYVTKPFTPEEITQAVQRLMRPRPAKREGELRSAPTEAEPWTPRAQEFRFWGQSWLQLGKDGSVRVGAVPARSQGGTVEAVHLPSIFESIYQGLPLASLTVADKPQLIMPSAVSGVVVAVNELLTEDPSALWDDPCGNGWIACLRPTRLEEDVRGCNVRRVILVNAHEASGDEQSKHLTRLGCQVRIVREWDELAPLLHDPSCHVVMIDAASFAERGPDLVQRINADAASVRIVVVASPGSRWEAPYRRHKILYYAVEPFRDNEIIDILEAAFRPPRSPPPQVERRTALSESMSGIWFTNRNGKSVRLVASTGLLRRDQGLGWHLVNKLADHHYPIETTLGNAALTPSALHDAASTCDRLLVLQAKDTGRLPGSLARDTKGEFLPVERDNVGKVTALVVQPAPPGCHPLEFDAMTIAALAEHLVQEMLLC
ncbi:MAG: response regulator [Phycisphaerae bacterium]|nr:response regulator [Phycisphaerae bacterium]